MDIITPINELPLTNSLAVTWIHPEVRWSMSEWFELWRFRDLLTVLAWRDIRLRYRQTALGIIWVLLQPLMAAGIFTFVFGKVAKLPSEGIPYFLFSYSALLGWNAFQTTLGKASSSLVGNAQLISKVYFPRMILPLSTVLSTMLDFGVGLLFVIPMYLYFRIVPGWGLCLLPLWIIMTTALASGIGVLLSALTVSYRDVQYVLPVFLQFLVYATPAGYAAAAVPARLQTLIFLNPLTVLMEGFRFSLVGTQFPPLGWLVYTIAFTLLACGAGVAVFRKMEASFSDVI